MLGDMSDDPKPSQPEQIPSEPPKQSPASVSPVVHELSVAPEYLLGSPAFAQPPLAQTHKLKAKNYAVHLLGAPHLTAEDKAVMIPAVAQWYVEAQAKTNKTILQRSPMTLRFARGLARERGKRVANSTLLRQIISPAFRSVKPKPAP